MAQFADAKGLYLHLEEKGIYLNPQQRQAVEDCSGRLLLLAVPGAGKTTILVTRLAYMIYLRNIRPENILTLTFSREAARDMAGRYQSLFGEEREAAPRFSTIHSFCYRVLRVYAQKKGSQLPKLLEESQRTKVIMDIYQSLNGERMPDELYEQISTAMSYGKNLMYSKEQMSGLLPQCQAFFPLFLRYEQLKREKGYFDYDDMLSFALTALKRYPSLLDFFCRQYPFVHVDEVQDTSLLQHEIIRLLVGKEGRLFMVGDEDQSIYGFRGACPEALLRFQEIYPGGKILKAEENFRSTQEIVSHAAQFIEINRSRYPKNMTTCREQGDKIRKTFLDSIEHQYSYLAAALSQIPDGETAAVLYRNNDSGLPLADMLDREKIPFYIRDHQPALLRHFVTADMLHFLRLYRNPSDVEAFLRVYYRMNAYITREEAEFVRRNSDRGENVFDILLLKSQQADFSDSGKSGNTARLQFLRYAVSQLGGLPPVKMLESMETDLGYLEFLRFRYSGTALDSALQKLGALKSIARSCPSLERFLSRLEEMDKVILNHSQRGTPCAVTLSTIHSSKGLEFDRVFLIDVLEGRLPSDQAVERQMEGDMALMEEEARLFYVAVTRAKNQLEIVSSARSDGGMVMPSRFIHRLVGEKKSGEFSLTAGERIKHKYFGEGTVLRLDEENHNIEIKFDRFGIKTLSTKVALSNFQKR